MAKLPPESYDTVLLNALAHEFSFSKKEETEALIKQRLKRKKLGTYDPQRVELLRRFKNELQHELGLRDKPWPPENPTSTAPAPPDYSESRYYLGQKGSHSDYADFDIPRLTAELIQRYPEIPTREIEWFVRYAVGIYYLL
jgi:hypothetical protein